MLLHALNIQPTRIVRMVILNMGEIFAAFREELVVVQVARIARNPVVVAHIDRLSHLLSGNQRLVKFLTVARTDHLDLRLTVFRINLGVNLL